MQLAGNGIAPLIAVKLTEAKHPRHIANGLLSTKRAESDDLGHVVIPIPVMDILNELAAAIIRDIQINVRHLRPSRIEKPFKQQMVFNRIHFGNCQSKCHQRARRGTTPGTSHNPDFMGVVHHIPHYQEVIGEAHFINDFKLISEPLLIVRRHRAHALLQPRLSQAGQIGRRRLVVRRGKMRQLWLFEFNGHLTARH